MSAVGLADPLTVLGGMPFLDDTFAAARLLAAVAAVRHVAAEHNGGAEEITGQQVTGWLDPEHVFMLRPDAPPMPAKPLVNEQHTMIKATIGDLARLMPTWAPLLKLPVVFSLLSPARGAVSASSRLWPQQVLLAAEAFGDRLELREQVIHELCHQWLYLVEELWALETTAAANLTLPSGTADRSAAEVLGAAHVVAALTRLYRADPVPLAGRLAQLAVYGAGCLDLLTELDHDLTDAGRFLARRLEEAL